MSLALLRNISYKVFVDRVTDRLGNICQFVIFFCTCLDTELCEKNTSCPHRETRTSGSVCGQDPEFCLDYVLGQADEWPDDITKWPVRTSVNLNVFWHSSSCLCL